MATRCLRLRSPILQLLQHPSLTHSNSCVFQGVRRYAQRDVNKTEGAPRVGDERAATLLKPNYEPSPIFGAVRPTPQESLKKPISRKQKEKSIVKTREAQKSKTPISEDDKMVLIFVLFYSD